MEKIIWEITHKLYRTKRAMQYKDEMSEEFELLYAQMVALEQLLLNAEKI